MRKDEGIVFGVARSEKPRSKSVPMHRDGFEAKDWGERAQ